MLVADKTSSLQERQVLETFEEGMELLWAAAVAGHGNVTSSPSSMHGWLKVTAGDVPSRYAGVRGNRSEASMQSQRGGSGRGRAGAG
eukprot:766041-Hanusia_phi.AAC.2